MVGCGWLWLVVVGCGWLWLVVVGCGWLWLVVVGCVLSSSVVFLLLAVALCGPNSSSDIKARKIGKLFV